MGLRFQGKLLVGLLVAFAFAAPMRAQVALTTVADTIYNANGTPAQGSVIVSWSAFTTAAGNAVPAGTTSVVLGNNGALSVSLAPNAGATPTGSYYTAVFHLSDGTTSREYWVVPAGGGSLKLTAVQNSVLPTSVAVQTVSKAYVDNAIAAAVGSGPAPTGSTATYVQKTGDTMTGPLVLPADPVSALQAADKHYVDSAVAGLGSGSAQKVSLYPSANQNVLQPAGSQLEINSLNGVLDASGFVSGGGNNGVGNALGSSNCGSGCEISISNTYVGIDGLPSGGMRDGTRVVDHRGGARGEVVQNPITPGTSDYLGHSETLISTTSAAQSFAQRGGTGENNQVLSLTHNALTGGSNQFPTDVEPPPYNKANYGVLQLNGNYNTAGQHVQFGNIVYCYAVGDCLAGGEFIRSSGGYRDQADEGAHPFDIQVAEDTRVYQGTCGSGCSTGATTVQINATAGNGTQGEGRFLMDTNPAKVISTGMIAGVSGDYLPMVTFTGTNFPVSVRMLLATGATSQAKNLSPGTVTLPITTSGVAAGYATSTAALPATSGVACIADQGVFPYFETAAYTVVDSSHVQVTLNKVHKPGAVFMVGGLCGYGLEQVADTQGGIRQIFPVVGSANGTTIYYAPAHSYVAGVMSATTTGSYLNVSSAVASASRSGNVVTLNLAQGMPYSVNGLSMIVSGIADASYNGTFQVTTTGPTTLQYTANGADGSSTGGSVSFNNGTYAMYPMAEVLSVYDPATASIDGSFTLAANTVPWASGDSVEQPHYYQQLTYGDTEFITQFVPRPVQYASSGKFYNGMLGPGARGWEVFNGVPSSAYLGAGGTHQVPDAALLTAGAWRNAVEVDAGTESVLRVHCNLHSCGRWDSSYALFAMDRNGGVEDFLFYSPQSSTASWLLGGTTYSFSPSGFSAGNVQATNLQATSVQTSSVQAASATVTNATVTNLVTSSLQTGANGNAQIASGGSAGYSNFTLNGNNNDAGRLGFIGGGTGDPNLYLDVPASGSFRFREGSVTPFAQLSMSGLSVPAVTSTRLGTGNGGNSDLAGTLTVSAGTTSSTVYSFTGSYSSSPVCMVQPQNAAPATVQALNGFAVQVSPAGVSVNVSSAPAGAVVFGYMCVARN